MRLRPSSPADLDAVLAVLVARDIADFGAPDFTREDLEADWAAEGWEGRVAEDGTGRIVGYAEVRGAHALGAVHPEAEGRGVGAAMLGWIEGRPGPRRQPIAESNARAHALLEAAGWARTWSYWRMTTELSAPAPRPAFRALQPDDACALHAVSEAAFASVAGHEPESAAGFTAEHLAAHDLDPELSRVAGEGAGPERPSQAGPPTSGSDPRRAEGAAVRGFALVRRWADEGTGYVDLLAVDPDAAGRGLGSALLEAVFAACARAGLKRCELYVGGFNARAIALYERAGMHKRWRTDRYERAG